MAKQPQTKPAGETLSAPSADIAALPARVAEMREAMLEAVRAHDIEALRPVIERNETMPLFARGADKPRTFADAIEFLKRRSFDGQGRETLALLGAALAQPYVKSTRGPSTTYVWPAMALVPAKNPREDDLLALYSCVRFANVGQEQPPVERLGIGADGTWHYFWSG
ncbi:MAG: hypothetical protein JWN93_3552 [Hyphomicrobiales bacterium]|nr:hypothetical protein [Hyphomicrobiales bacterium]